MYIQKFSRLLLSKNKNKKIILPFAKQRERERERDFPSSIFGKITYVSQSHQNTKPYISYMLPLFHAQYLTNEILTWVSNLTMKKNY